MFPLQNLARRGPLTHKRVRNGTNLSVIGSDNGLSPVERQAIVCLTHRGRDEIDDILQTTFSNAFYWI